MPGIFSIGKAKTYENRLCVYVESKYRKGMKEIGCFSHLNIACVCENKLLILTGKVICLEEKKGEIVLSCSQAVTGKDMELIDIKPYMPSEDSAGNSNADVNRKEMINKSNDAITVEPVPEEEDMRSYRISFAGEIRNTHGVTYLQYEEGKMPKSFSMFENVIWWFDKFEDNKFRRILQCKPPYESEDRIGVFACRAPIRPNPIATTLTKVEKVDFDNNRVYISGIESFDHTPFLGIIDYLEENNIERNMVFLPDWASDWPNHIDVRDKEEKMTSVNALIHELDKKVNLYNSHTAKISSPGESNLQREKPTHIIVKGARENNLKGISVSIPYGKITAVVGVSGSGKSSLVMDTVYAECRRRMEYLSSEKNNHPRPEMDSMVGCMPTVMISQKEIRGRANSTIGTFSGINNHPRSIYATIGKKQLQDENTVDLKLTPAAFSFLDFE